MALLKVIDDILPALSSIEYDGNIRVEYSNTTRKQLTIIRFDGAITSLRLRYHLDENGHADYTMEKE